MLENHSFDVEHEQPSNAKLFLFGLAMVVALFVCGVVLTQIFYQSVSGAIYSKVLSPPSPALVELRAHEERVLTRYEWVDATKGQVRIPIDRAMELVVKESPK